MSRHPRSLSACSFCFFNDTATTEIYTLSLHDALPVWPESPKDTAIRLPSEFAIYSDPARSEEHTSELQSHVNLVCRLLLEKKKKNTHCACTSSTTPDLPQYISASQRVPHTTCVMSSSR